MEMNALWCCGHIFLVSAFTAATTSMPRVMQFTLHPAAADPGVGLTGGQ